MAAAAMSAGASTGGRAASSGGVIRPRDRREAGVSTRPGQMQLTRTPIVSRSGARQAVNRITPALATAYSGESWAVVPSPAVEAMLMIAPPPRSAIGGEDKLCGEHDRPQVQVEGLLPLGRVRRGEARLLDASGVVDQHADPARRINGRPDTGPGRDICGDERPADPRRCGRPGLLVEIGDNHVHALRREPLSDPGAYPFRTPCHQSGLSLEVHRGIVCGGSDNFEVAIPRAGTVRVTSSPSWS